MLDSDFPSKLMLAESVVIFSRETACTLLSILFDTLIVELSAVMFDTDIV